MIRVRDNINLEILRKFGFEENNGIWAYIRRINGEIAYMVYVTKRHRYLQIRCNKNCLIAGKLQSLIYDLTIAGIIEKEEEK